MKRLNYNICPQLIPQMAQTVWHQCRSLKFHFRGMGRKNIYDKNEHWEFLALKLSKKSLQSTSVEHFSPQKLSAHCFVIVAVCISSLLSTAIVLLSRALLDLFIHATTKRCMSLFKLKILQCIPYAGTCGLNPLGWNTMCNRDVSSCVQIAIFILCFHKDFERTKTWLSIYLDQNYSNMQITHTHAHTTSDVGHFSLQQAIDDTHTRNHSKSILWKMYCPMKIGWQWNGETMLAKMAIVFRQFLKIPWIHHRQWQQ